MAVWRTRACSTFGLEPGSYSYTERKRILFADLVECARQALRDGDDPRLRKIIEYVSWAAAQKSDDLDSVVDLAFFLRVFRDASLCEQLKPFLPAELFAEKWKLLIEQPCQ